MKDKEGVGVDLKKGKVDVDENKKAEACWAFQTRVNGPPKNSC